MRSAISRTLHQFLKTTTLHGFKYFMSPFYIDRIGWLLWSLASACCAGVLCAVVWARFLQLPALLILEAAPTPRTPTVTICPTPERAAQLFAKHFNLTEHQILVLPTVLKKILGGKRLARDQVVFLERILKSHNVLLSEALLKSTPDCNRITKACRWRKKMTPCNWLFKKELTQWGACCIAPADKMSVESGSKDQQTNSELVLLLECSDGTIPYSCEYFTKFSSQEWVSPVALATGYEYSAQITYTAIQDAATERLLATNCVSRENYSRTRCLIRCKEVKCGCSDPLRTIKPYEEVNMAPPCSVTQLNCLRSFKLIEESCSCLPRCKKVSRITALENNKMNELDHTINPIYTGINVSTSTVLSIFVRASSSKVFNLVFSETWWSLLSTLGGVFNMFLGVGLFSALEILFLLIAKLPVAIRRSTEMHTNTTTVPLPLR